MAVECLAAVCGNLEDAVRCRRVELVGKRGLMPMVPTTNGEESLVLATSVAACVEPGLVVCAHDLMIALSVGSLDQVTFLSEEQVRSTTLPIGLEVLFIERAIGWEKLALLQVKLLNLGNVR